MTLTDLEAAPATPAFQPLTGNLGAEVSGIDISQPVDSQTVSELKAALVKHKVIFFRDQDVPTRGFLDFALNFGTPAPYSLGKLGNLTFHPRYSDVAVLESTPTYAARADVWHSDLTFEEQPSFGSMLYCLEAPAVGGDTLWADMEAAYEGLDDATRSHLSSLTAVHDWRAQITNARARGVPEEDIQELIATLPPMEHPVVRTHPVSGRKSIYVNVAFTKHIVGMSETESAALLNRLFLLSSRPDYQVRFRWRKGSIAFWDNRSTQHYAVLDYFGQRRRMERVTFAGEKVQ